jgi:hypothetical protein
LKPSATPASNFVKSEKQKMSFLNSIKGALFEGDTSATPQAPATVSTLKQPIQGVAATPGVNIQPSVNTDMVDSIRKVTMSKNTALTAVLNAADLLTDVIPDPTMRIKAAIKTSSGGRTPKQIVDAIQIHVSDVDGEEMRFQRMIETKTQTEIGGMQSEISASQARATAIAQEIEALHKRIADLGVESNTITQRQSELNSQIAVRTSELQRAQVEFATAANVVRAELESHRNVIASIQA